MNEPLKVAQEINDKIRAERARFLQQKQQNSFEESLTKVRSEIREEMDRAFDDLKGEIHTIADAVNKMHSQPLLITEPDSTTRGVPITQVLKYHPVIFGRKEEVVREFHKLNDTMITTAYLMKHPVHTLKIYQDFISKSGGSVAAQLGKALSDTPGFGSDWFPTEYSTEFIARMEGQYQVAGTFPSQLRIPQGVDRMRVPAVGQAMTMYKLTGSSDDDVAKITASTFGTRYVELDPITLGVRLELDESTVEDSVVAIAEYANMELQTTAARVIDDICINGDTTLPGNQDSDVTANANAKTSWNGLRKLSPSGSRKDAAGTLTTALTQSVAQTMESGISQYGNIDDLVYLVNLKGYWQLMVLSENLTREKRGELATIETGKLVNFMGIPIVMSSRIRSDLNASGVYDGVTTTKTMAIIYNRQAFLRGMKRDITIKSEEVISTDRRRSVLTLRMDFKSKMQTGEPVAGYLYNVTV